MENKAQQWFVDFTRCIIGLTFLNMLTHCSEPVKMIKVMAMSHAMLVKYAFTSAIFSPARTDELKYIHFN